MPELPEVQTVVSGLGRILPGQVVQSAEIFWEGAIATPSPEEFQQFILGKKVEKLFRRAKFIAIEFSDHSLLLVHLRMSGQLLWRKVKPTQPRPHLRVRLHFVSGAVLDFEDSRKFGRMYLYAGLAAAERAMLYRFGADALDVSWEEFRKRLQKRPGGIKALLLRQDLLSGVGNIYADESLFRAGIHPESKANMIPEVKLRDLHRELQQILREAIELKGTTVRTYLDVNGRVGQFKNFLQVYRKTGKACRRCEVPIKRLRVAGRGTHICARCQRKYV